MRLVMAKICERVSHSRSGRMTLNGLFTNVLALGFPVVHPPFDIVVEMEFEPPEWGKPYELEILLIDEDGRTIFSSSANQAAPSGKGPGTSRAVMVNHVPGVVFAAPGPYRMDVVVDGKKMGEERLPVLNASAP